MASIVVKTRRRAGRHAPSRAEGPVLLGFGEQPVDLATGVFEDRHHPLLYFSSGRICRLGDCTEQLSQLRSQVDLVRVDTLGELLPGGRLDFLSCGATFVG